MNQVNQLKYVVLPPKAIQVLLPEQTMCLVNIFDFQLIKVVHLEQLDVGWPQPNMVKGLCLQTLDIR
jgi:hypothetical protein